MKNLGKIIIFSGSFLLLNTVFSTCFVFANEEESTQTLEEVPMETLTVENVEDPVMPVEPPKEEMKEEKEISNEEILQPEKIKRTYQIRIVTEGDGVVLLKQNDVTSTITSEEEYTTQLDEETTITLSFDETVEKVLVNGEVVQLQEGKYECVLTKDTDIHVIYPMQKKEEVKEVEEKEDTEEKSEVIEKNEVENIEVEEESKEVENTEVEENDETNNSTVIEASIQVEEPIVHYEDRGYRGKLDEAIVFDSFVTKNYDRFLNNKNPFTVGQCTWFAWSRFYQVYGYDSGARGNGKMNAFEIVQHHKDSFQLSSTPAAGAVFSLNKNTLYPQYGHVGFIEAYDGEYVWISEGNVKFENQLGNIWIHKVNWETFKATYPDVVFAVPNQELLDFNKFMIQKGDLLKVKVEKTLSMYMDFIQGADEISKVTGNRMKYLKM